MIYTLTLNPSIDYVIKINDFKLGMVNRIDNEFKYAGGKGINVSRVLSEFNIENKALGYIGGFPGKFIETFLNKEGVETDFIEISEDTRINVKLKSEKETEMNGKGPQITNRQLNELFTKIDNINSGDFLVLAGNIQSSLNNNLYAEIMNRCKERKVKIIVDTTGEALMATLKYRPFLIKPNKQELEEIVNQKLNSVEDIISSCKKLISMGVENVIVSMAGEGALFVNDNEIYLAIPPKGEVKNSVGAGDSLVAGFLATYYSNKSIEESFKFAVAAGSATAFSNDLCTKEKVYEILTKVNVKKIKY